MSVTTVAIVGAPGAGKSTVGRQLARRLGLPLVDVDLLIEEQQGKLIREIFADHGEEHFRELERVATLQALSRPGVISMGGGAVMNPAIREELGRHEVVWLQVSVTQSTRRIGLNQARPLLLGNLRAQLIKLLEERTPLYASVATVTVDTDKKSPGQVVEAIVDQLRGCSA